MILTQKSISNYQRFEEFGRQQYRPTLQLVRKADSTVHVSVNERDFQPECLTLIATTQSLSLSQLTFRKPVLDIQSALSSRFGDAFTMHTTTTNSLTAELWP